jgi:hypothetical protein
MVRKKAKKTPKYKVGDLVPSVPASAKDFDFDDPTDQKPKFQDQEGRPNLPLIQKQLNVVHASIATVMVALESEASGHDREFALVLRRCVLDALWDVIESLDSLDDLP